VRRALQADGVTFRGRSDTEVLLRAYERWGTACFEKLNGMWAITLWDGPHRRLIAARDRFGVKPLYYTRVDGVWVLASEIKALLHHPGVAPGVNDRAVFEYLAFGVVDHRTDTFFQDVRAVAPGTWMEFGEGEPVTHRFWRLPEAASPTRRTDREWIDDFDALFSDSVRLRVRSDVPIGTMLSGGLDSTAITALISEHRDRDTGPVREADAVRDFHHAFTACWPGWDGDEEADVDRIGRRFGLSVHKVYLDGEMLLERLPCAVRQLDEPFMTPVCLVNLELMKMAREHGVKVVLNGHASDEVLGGYAEMFVPPYLADLLRTGRLARAAREFAAFRGLVTTPVTETARELVGDDTTLRAALRALASLRGSNGDGVFSPEMLGRYRYRTAIDHDGGPAVRDRFGRMARRKFFTEYVPQWLRMEDRMSMAASVEARLPFMDYRLVELAFRLPTHLKLRDGHTKYVLRQAMANRLPPETLEQRHKRKFSTPHVQWFRTSWRKTIEEALMTETACVSPYLDGRAFRRALRAWLDGDDGVMAPNLVWRALGTELWFQLVAGKVTA
jgi:asparagine synthase (glutamine-hydrolysing)